MGQRGFPRKRRRGTRLPGRERDEVSLSPYNSAGGSIQRYGCKPSANGGLLRLPLKTESGHILCFVDDTYYKAINREYVEKQPVVALAHFDNREELARDSSGSEDARIASEVEQILTNWAQSMGDFCGGFPVGGS